MIGTGWRYAGVIACVFLTACSTRVTPNNPAPAAVSMLLRPTIIIVDDFDIDPGAVRVDSGIGGVARRIIAGKDTSTEQAQAAAAVCDAMRNALIASLNRMNLPVRSTILGPGTPPYVEVRGTVTSIDEGNQTRRNIVGFGAGKSDVQATAAAYYIAPGAQPMLLQSFDGSADSGHMPGLAVGAGSAAAGHAVAAAANVGSNAATVGHADTQADAQRMAQDLGTKLGAVFAQQGWIPASAVK